MCDIITIVVEEHNIDALELPKNMTSLLQVVDLIINGPLKADQRRVRIRSLYNYFNEYAIAIAEATEKGQSLDIQWKPKSMSMMDGILTLIQSIVDFNSRVQFKESVAECFVKVGIMPTKSGTFNLYTAATKNRFLPSNTFVDTDSIEIEGECSTDGCSKYKPNEIFDLVRMERDDDELAIDIDAKLAKLSPTEEDDDDYEIGEAPLEPAPDNDPTPVHQNEPALKIYTEQQVMLIKSKKELILLLNKRGFSFIVKKCALSIKELRERLVHWRPEGWRPEGDEPPQEPAEVALPPVIVQEDELKYCIAKCTLPSEGTFMIECTNPSCTTGNKWFHPSCLKLSYKSDRQVPKDWICPVCHINGI